ncbi:MAG: carboxypeptidase regulatory-like domain-containing protein, partial [Acidobacteria bacterium]
MAIHLSSRRIVFVLALVTLSWASFGFGQNPQQTPPSANEPAPQSHGTGPAQEQPSGQVPGNIASGSIIGSVVDQSGALVAGARVTLNGGGPSSSQVALTGADGQFSFTNIVPGPFRLTITSSGFAAQTSAGILHLGEVATVPQIVLDVASNVTEVDVGVPQVEVAAEQMKIEETQRVLGAIPNFYVSYIPNAAPLNSKQKFQLAWKTSIDPFTLVVVADTAGVQQAQNHFREYGQGTQGYAKRFGAVYADTLTGTFIGGAMLPSLLKQDPRYFYNGTGSAPSRVLYAIANAVICKGDNGHWQPNYS